MKYLCVVLCCVCVCVCVVLFFQAEGGIRDLVRSRGLGDVYKRQELPSKALSTEGGGTVPIDPRDPKGTKTMQRVFQLSLIHI